MKYGIEKFKVWLENEVGHRKNEVWYRKKMRYGIEKYTCVFTQGMIAYIGYNNKVSDTRL